MRYDWTDGSHMYSVMPGMLVTSRKVCAMTEDSDYIYIVSGDLPMFKLGKKKRHIEGLNGHEVIEVGSGCTITLEGAL